MSQALSSTAFQTYATLLKTRSGLVIGPDKLYLLETRLAPILKSRSCVIWRRSPIGCAHPMPNR